MQRYVVLETPNVMPLWSKLHALLVVDLSIFLL
jgi:hypothetical protein